tara:strand:+ start:14474 stop:15361 length:888 start_codon:yes stop_codon:yes gene_type:complete
MILTTQGHEKGIGLEVFIKSFFKLDLLEKNHRLYCFKESLLDTLDNLRLPLSFSGGILSDGHKNLSLKFCENRDIPQTMACLLAAIKDSSEGDILHTLPSSKDQFKFENKKFKGHTDFLGDYYDLDAGMCFLSPDSNFLLLTDHIPLDQVYKSLKEQDLIQKIKSCISGFPKDRKINQVLIAGINPHAGEEGVISTQDQLIFDLSKKLNMEANVYSGDTMHFSRENINQLLIYPSHDQGLGVFKALYGLIGINFTANLPVRRVSVDHGTAFNLFGKDAAKTAGMEFLLSEVENWE